MPNKMAKKNLDQFQTRSSKGLIQISSHGIGLVSHQGCKVVIRTSLLT